MGNSSDERPLNRAVQPSSTPTIREQPSFESEKQDRLSTTSPTEDFDPCAAAKPCSPFYLYKHDSPRPSTDQSHLKAPDSSIQVSVHELEAGSRTPSESPREKNKNSGEYFSQTESLSWPRKYWSRSSSFGSSRPSSWIQADYRT